MSQRLSALPPAESVAEGPYDLKAIKAPVLTGLPLRVFLFLLEGPLGGIIMSKLFRMNNYPQVLGEQFLPEKPTFRPQTQKWVKEEGDFIELEFSQSGAVRAELAANTVAGYQDTRAQHPGGRNTALDFHRAYKAGRITPSQVAENVIQAIQQSERQDPPMRFLVAFNPDHVRQQAAASSARYAAGTPLSPLDGVPFAVKDAMDVEGYPTTAGTAFMAEWRQPEGTVPGVKSLAAAGAILIGKASLHEIGLGTTGLNTVHGTPRNPFDPGRHTGGSSSGSAALVAAGVVPFAVGTDGGGSIRIPASLCGCVGLKPTHDRVWTLPHPPIDQTVSVTGPIAGCVEDCLLMYSVLANCGHPEGVSPPPLTIPRELPPPSAALPLKGKRGGVFWQWFEDGNPAVVEVCKEGVRCLERLGMEVVGVTLPELEALRVAHTCTIVSEMRNNMQGALMNPSTKARFNRETRASLTVGAGFTSAQYIQAQKIRTRTEAHFRRVFEEGGCGFIITPTVPCVAPPIPSAALQRGISDIGTTTMLMRFMLGPNMLGLPAISVPVGAVMERRADSNSNSATAGGSAMPVGLQLIGPAWHEASLLHAAAALESALGGDAVPSPAVWYDVLQAGNN